MYPPAHPAHPPKDPRPAKLAPPADSRDKHRADLEIPLGPGLTGTQAGLMENTLAWNSAAPTEFTGRMTLVLDADQHPDTMAAHWYTPDGHHLAVMIELDWSGDGPRVREAMIGDVADEPPRPADVPLDVFRFKLRPPGAPSWIRQAIDVLSAELGLGAPDGT